MAATRGFLTIFLFLALTACAGRDANLKKQSVLESRVESLARGSNLSNQQISILSNSLKDLQEEVRSNAELLRDLRDKVAALRTDADVLLVRRAAVPYRAGNQKIELINKDEADTSKGKTDPTTEAYMKAFGLYGANKYDEAVEAFTSFIRTYPGSEYAANAQYWIGECYYTRSNLPSALEAFKRVISNYPAGNKAPDAMLKAGYTLFALKQNKSAEAMLESLVSRFPDSPAAVKARERLGRP